MEQISIFGVCMLLRESGTGFVFHCEGEENQRRPTMLTIKRAPVFAFAALLTAGTIHTASAIDLGVSAGVGGISADVGASTDSGANANVGIGSGTSASASVGGNDGTAVNADVSVGYVSASTSNSLGDGIDSDTNVNTGETLSDFMADVGVGVGGNTVGVDINGGQPGVGDAVPGAAGNKGAGISGLSGAQLTSAFRSLSPQDRSKLISECEKALASPARWNRAKLELCQLIQ
ncbi:MAG: hypothetical protein H6888_01775 [Nitratireductor sp.]|nr:hypothetical protein [Nitratireductor sp.]MCC0019779.1 hypothetical protein [Nitratireductor sp.]